MRASDSCPLDLTISTRARVATPRKSTWKTPDKSRLNGTVSPQADCQHSKLTYGASNNLGENVQLVLCFMPRVLGLFEKRFSIVWK